jgi:DNA gyrase subunit A
MCTHLPSIHSFTPSNPFILNKPSSYSSSLLLLRSQTTLSEESEYDPTAQLTESEIATQANELLSSSNNKMIELPTEISTSFMQYALSIILGRALPDARDGLKPVHRRILFAMNGLGLGPGGSYRKCARVVGEVLGKFHPHGDTAVYDALVRLAQPFSTNIPLIDGHGNFGSIDADPAAAMRYTECRLTKLSSETLLDDIHLDTVDFLPNFDGSEYEPAVLPAKVPVLLLNGGAGIAVGMATNIPPHNLGELMDACVVMVKGRNEEREVRDGELLKIVPGPDFPTGACIIGKSGAKSLYTTGNGGVVMRAVMHLEEISSGKKKRNAIIITELPYQVNKAALLERIASLVNEKKLEGIADLRDESDRDGIRVVIELKRDAVAAVVQNNLLKKTALQSTFSGNFLALFGSGTVPQRFTLRKALDCFLDFRFETIRKKCVYQLDKVEARAHIVDGLLIALDSTDKVIEIVRNAPDQASAKAALMDPDTPDLGLSSAQADAVLRLQLGQLTRLNGDKLKDEKKTLSENQSTLKNLLTNDSAVRDSMIEEFEGLKKRFATARKTKIMPEEDEVDEIEYIQNEQSVIVVTRGGYIKRMPLKSFQTQNRGTRGKRGASNTMSNDDNEVAHCFTCNDHDTILMTTQSGVAYGLRAYQVPEGSRTAKGAPIPSVLPIKSEDVITSVLPVSEFSKDEFIVLATEFGWIKKTPLAAFEKLSSRGLIIATLAEGDRLNWCEKCTDSDDILLGSTRGQATRFSASDLRPTGRTSRGVKSMTLKKGDTIADMNVLRKDDEHVLVITKEGYGKRVKTEEFRTTARGGSGVIALKFKAGRIDDRISNMRIVNEDDEILLITSHGVMVRQKVKDIPSQGRAATGVLVQKVDIKNGDYISAVSIVPRESEEA